MRRRTEGHRSETISQNWLNHLLEAQSELLIYSQQGRGFGCRDGKKFFFFFFFGNGKQAQSALGGRSSDANQANRPHLLNAMRGDWQPQRQTDYILIEQSCHSRMEMAAFFQHFYLANSLKIWGHPETTAHIDLDQDIQTKDKSY